MLLTLSELDGRRISGGADSINKAVQLQPDVVLKDFRVPSMSAKRR